VTGAAVTIVRIEGSGVEIAVDAGESVAEAAWRQGFVWPTKCWGQMDCMQCFVRVKDGEQNIVPADEDELFAMRTMFPPRLRSSLTRLGCQVHVTGPGVVLEKKGVRPPPYEKADPR
jgi:2Fe-2S ferredoxin